jgi:Uma2 family endonuclease
MAVAELEDIDVELTDVPRGYELIDGELTEMPEMGSRANRVTGKAFGALLDWERETRQGVVVAHETAYACWPDRPKHFRKPDISFICCDPETFEFPVGSLSVVPDLIIEVLSPTNTDGDIEDRVDDFFAAGTRLAWIIDPELRYAMIQRPDDSIQKIRESGSLTGEDVLPGFTLPLAAILPKPSA